MIIGAREFQDIGHTYIMGILNVTPDSFSDGGTHNTLDGALFHTEKMIREGADIIDVGGESTRPGYTMISDEEEIERTAPVIEAIRNRFDIPISLDTYKASVAEEGLRAGAHLINDIWGFRNDPKMASVVARANASCVLMHNRKEVVYGNFMEDVLDDLKQSIALARQAGIPENRICLDPGVGFAKDTHQNLVVIRELNRMKELGYPILLGTSRKSVIGNTLNLPKDEREEGTLATSVLAAAWGISFVRVHDVEKNYRAIKMAEAILQVEE